MIKSPDAFRTISEVSEWLDRPTHVLRFWESKFPQIKPVKRAGGRRYYRPQDMLLLGGIKRLLHDDGMTIKGVQKMLREQGVAHVSALSQALDEDLAAALAQAAPAPIAGFHPEAPMSVMAEPASEATTARVLQFRDPGLPRDPVPVIAPKPAQNTAPKPIAPLPDPDPRDDDAQLGLPFDAPALVPPPAPSPAVPRHPGGLLTQIARHPGQVTPATRDALVPLVRRLVALTERMRAPE